MPASWFQTANAFFILVLSAPIGALWIYLKKKHINPYVPVKFGLGLIQMGFGFFIMYWAAQYAVEGIKVGLGWLVFTYLFTHWASCS